MPSLTKIFGFAAVAFAAFASAAPTSNKHDVGLADISGNNVEIVDRSVCNACIEPGVPTLPEILVGLHADVKVEIDLLTGITRETCKPEVVKPIVVRLVAKIEAAIVKIKLLSKYTLAQILFDGKVVISVRVLAILICDLFITICNALGLVLVLLGSVKGEVYALLCLVGVALGSLLKCILAVVGGIVAELLAILCVDLRAVFWVIAKLKLSLLCDLLKIDIKLFL